MSHQYRVEIAFYVEAESDKDALFAVEDGISSKLAANYDWLETLKVSR